VTRRLALAEAMADEFSRFFLVGCLAALGHYSTLTGLRELLGVPVVLSSAVGFVIGAAISYTLNYRFTFRSAKPHREAVAKFLTVALSGLCLNTAIMWSLADQLGMFYLAAQAVATALVLFWNFLANRLWTFRSDGHASLPRDRGPVPPARPFGKKT
jgi:putative flippase GtrA